jgi:hypothetical protein
MSYLGRIIAACVNYKYYNKLKKVKAKKIKISENKEKISCINAEDTS